MSWGFDGDPNAVPDACCDPEGHERWLQQQVDTRVSAVMERLQLTEARLHAREAEEVAARGRELVPEHLAPLADRDDFDAAFSEVCRMLPAEVVGDRASMRRIAGALAVELDACDPAPKRTVKSNGPEVWEAEVAQRSGLSLDELRALNADPTGDAYRAARRQREAKERRQGLR